MNTAIRIFVPLTCRKHQNIQTSLSYITNKLYSTMTKPRVYITREINKEAIDLLKKTCDVTAWTASAPVPREELLKNVSGKSAILCLLSDKIDKEVLDKAGDGLKVIATMSVGYDHLSVDEIKNKNIRIGYTPNILTEATGELTVALLLATSRRLIEANEEAKNGGWKAWAPFWMCGPGLANSTVGIVGFGRIGQEVASILKGFKPKRIVYQNRSEKSAAAKEIGAVRVEFDELLTESDFVISTCALTSDTQNLFNETAFKKMKNTSVFINTSRGGVVDQDALIYALKNRIIWGAGLDVTTPEPLPLDNELLRFKNCVVLPHIGSASNEARNAMGILCAQNILSALNNENMPAELIL